MGTKGEADDLGLLREAIARNATMVLSLPQGGKVRHHRTRFLADAGDGFWVASVEGESAVIQQVIADRQPAGVAFRSGETKVIFATQVEHFEPEFRSTTAADDADAGPLPALLLRFPAEVRAVQRRKSFRVPVAGGSSDLQVKLWTMTEQAALRDKPVASREILCEARDISVGGIGLTIHALGGKPESLGPGERLRVQLTLRDTVALLEGRLRYAPRPSEGGRLRAGVQFRTLDDSREDRLAASQLNKIVNELQRELIRRKKLGLPGPGA